MRGGKKKLYLQQLLPTKQEPSLDVATALYFGKGCQLQIKTSRRKEPILPKEKQNIFEKNRLAAFCSHSYAVFGIKIVNTAVGIDFFQKYT